MTTLFDTGQGINNEKFYVIMCNFDVYVTKLPMILNETNNRNFNQCYGNSQENEYNLQCAVEQMFPFHRESLKTVEFHFLV